MLLELKTAIFTLFSLKLRLFSNKLAVFCYINKILLNVSRETIVKAITVYFVLFSNCFTNYTHKNCFNGTSRGFCELSTNTILKIATWYTNRAIIAIVTINKAICISLQRFLINLVQKVHVNLSNTIVYWSLM